MKKTALFNQNNQTRFYDPHINENPANISNQNEEHKELNSKMSNGLTENKHESKIHEKKHSSDHETPFSLRQTNIKNHSENHHSNLAFSSMKDSPKFYSPEKAQKRIEDIDYEINKLELKKLEMRRRELEEQMKK